jgi:hypothetical protein
MASWLLDQANAYARDLYQAPLAAEILYDAVEG